MFKRKRLKHKTDPLLLLALFAGLAVFMTTLSAADDSFLLHPNLDDLKDGEVVLVPIGQRGSGVRMAFKTPGRVTVNNKRVMLMEEAASAVHLSVVMPW